MCCYMHKTVVRLKELRNLKKIGGEGPLSELRPRLWKHHEDGTPQL